VVYLLTCDLCAGSSCSATFLPTGSAGNLQCLLASSSFPLTMRFGQDRRHFCFFFFFFFSLTAPSVLSPQHDRRVYLEREQGGGYALRCGLQPRLGSSSQAGCRCFINETAIKFGIQGTCMQWYCFSRERCRSLNCFTTNQGFQPCLACPGRLCNAAVAGWSGLHWLGVGVAQLCLCAVMHELTCFAETKLSGLRNRQAILERKRGEYRTWFLSTMRALPESAVPMKWAPSGRLLSMFHEQRPASLSSTCPKSKSLLSVSCTYGASGARPLPFPLHPSEGNSFCSSFAWSEDRLLACTEAAFCVVSGVCCC
jgi:hypothetical protein